MNEPKRGFDTSTWFDKLTNQAHFGRLNVNSGVQLTHRFDLFTYPHF
jgi:hypothetical protein